MQALAGGALLDALRGVHWPGRRLTSGAIHGEHRSRRVGTSAEFMDYRSYRQGDDPAKIDWKVFGRTERAAIRISHDDSSLPTVILVDASASMAFPLDSLAKWELAASVALGLCAVANGEGDPVGLTVAAGAGVRALTPRTRRDTMSNVLQLLLDTRPSGSLALAPVLAALHAARRIAIVGDFLGDSEALLAEARPLIAAGREVFAVHVVAREELDPVPAGTVADPEDASIRRPLGSSDVAEYREAFTAWRAALGAAWRDAGAVYHEAVTGDRPDSIVRRVVSPVEAESRAV